MLRSAQGDGASVGRRRLASLAITSIELQGLPTDLRPDGVEGTPYSTSPREGTFKPSHPRKVGQHEPDQDGKDALTGDTGKREDDGQREHIIETNRQLAGQGLRVLAVAWRPGWDEKRIADLTFLGLVGMQDPVRPGVKETLGVCREAGLRIIMLTGDQRATAEAIGAELGLDPGAIRSRVSPQEKLALVEQLQAEGDIVAMTGDGINDAPALARADIGIAMGRLGTDVAREAADVVLTDDDFSTIVRAIAEGRTIYANLRKVIHFLFSCNLSEILTILIAIAAGFPSPLLPLQILWVNIVTDILPAVALIQDPAEPDVMRRPARDPGEAMITWHFGRRMLMEGLLLALGVLSAYGVTVWLRRSPSQHGSVPGGSPDPSAAGAELSL